MVSRVLHHDALYLSIVARNVILNPGVEGVGVRDVGKKGEQPGEVGVGGYRRGIERWTRCGASQGDATLLCHCSGYTAREQCTCNSRGQQRRPSPYRYYALGSPSFANSTLIPLSGKHHVVSLPSAQIWRPSACIVLLLRAHTSADVHPPLLESGPEIVRLIVVYPGLRYRSLASVCNARSKLLKTRNKGREMQATACACWFLANGVVWSRHTANE